MQELFFCVNSKPLQVSSSQWTLPKNYDKVNWTSLSGYDVLQKRKQLKNLFECKTLKWCGRHWQTYIQTFISSQPLDVLANSYLTIVQGGRGGGVDGISPLVFVLLRQSEINIHWLDSSQLALQDVQFLLVTMSYSVK